MTGLGSCSGDLLAFDSLADALSIGMIVLDASALDGPHVVRLTPRAERILGYGFAGKRISDVAVSLGEVDLRAFLVSIATGQAVSSVVGAPLEVAGIRIQDAFAVRLGDTCVGFIVGDEIGLRLIELETRLLEAKKLEAIGLLAGDVAHDFNNELLAIGGYLEFALAEIDDPRARKRVGIALAAVDRAKSLVVRLLVTSR